MFLPELFFYLLAVLVIGSAVVVAFSRNIVHSAFALLGTFLGMAGLYVYLSADFLAGVQTMVYVGGVLVLILFAVMLTTKIEQVNVSNKSSGLAAGLLLLLATTGLLVGVSLTTPWQVLTDTMDTPTTALIGNALLGEYVLPFEVASVLLIAALIGAVALVKKEEK